MNTNSSQTATRMVNYKLSYSYPSVKPLLAHDNNGLVLKSLGSSGNLTKSWSNFQNLAVKNPELTNNSDLQPLNWLQRHSIIDIDPLDVEDEIKDDGSNSGCKLPPKGLGHDDLMDTQLSYQKVEVESQENSNIHDFVRYQAMRNSMNGGGVGRAALRNSNSYIDHGGGQLYQHSVNGFVKPNLSYTQLIFMAIETCRDRAMTVNDIYQWCETNYPYYKHIGPSWKNSLRHNLSINKSFRRMPRDGQQGGPGRGAYWIVDEKERKNLIESIYRAQQAMPLGDRNGQRLDQSYSFILNPPKNGPMLRIDGKFTDASTYFQNRRSNDENAGDGKLFHLIPPNYDCPNQNELGTENLDGDYSSMMRGLTSIESPTEAEEPSVKLSNSTNSNVSRLEDRDSEPSRPIVKNRRKTKHEKVRTYSDLESLREQYQNANSLPKISNTYKDPLTESNKSTQSSTSVNVIVAPHFDHIYARYQQFLPPAIPSDMEKAAFLQQDDGDSNLDAEFLKNGFREDDDDNDENNDFIKSVKIEPRDTFPSTFMKSTNSFRFGRSFGSKLSTSSLLLARKKKARVVLAKKVRRRFKRRRRMDEDDLAIKQEMLDPNELQQVASDRSVDVRGNIEVKSNEDVDMVSDGYGTDSTMPMVLRTSLRPRRNKSFLTTTVKTKSKAAKLITAKRKSVLKLPERRYRPHRRRVRPLRIDEFREADAIKILASLKQQTVKNIDNLYNFNNYLQSTTRSDNESSCNSSVITINLSW